MPEVVFAGRSEGRGELRLALSQRRSFTVTSVGTSQDDGRFRLDQRLHIEGQPARLRTWMIWQATPRHYSVTLSDAAGPVVARVEGNRMLLHYPVTRWGLVMHQTLALSKDEQTVINSGSLRFLGIPVGHLQEVIQLTR